jgi:uncharacterized Zn finger protein (UPF0148 family)
MERFGAPPIKLNQTELSALLKMTHEVFGSVTTSGFFMKMPVSAQMAVINSVVGLDRKQLIEERIPTTQVPWRLIKLVSTKTDADAVARERRMVQNQLAAAQGSLKEIQAQTAVVGGSTNSVADQARLAELEKEVAKTRADDQWLQTYRLDKSRYDSAKALYDQHVTKAAQLKQSFDALPVIEEWTAQHDATFEDAYTKASAQHTELLSRKKPTPAVPQFKSVPNGDVCPTCNQTVTSEHRSKVDAEKNATLVAYNELEREVANYNAKIDEELKALANSMRVVKTEAEIRKREWTEHRHRKEMLQNSIQSLGHPVEPKEPIPPMLHFSAEQKAAVLKEYQEVSDRVRLSMALLTAREGAGERMAQYQAQIQGYQAQIDSLAAVEELLKKLPEIELEQTLTKLSLPGVEVKLVDGFLDVRVKGIPYACLSDGRRAKTDLLWIQCLRGLLANPPGFVFCDNADLVDSFEGVVPENVQVIFANVNRQLTELQVVNL